MGLNQRTGDVIFAGNFPSGTVVRLRMARRGIICEDWLYDRQRDISPTQKSGEGQPAAQRQLVLSKHLRRWHVGTGLSARLVTFRTRS